MRLEALDDELDVLRSLIFLLGLEGLVDATSTAGE